MHRVQVDSPVCAALHLGRVCTQALHACSKARLRALKNLASTPTVVLQIQAHQGAPVPVPGLAAGVPS
jgi:hypothetical protein